MAYSMTLQNPLRRVVPIYRAVGLASLGETGAMGIAVGNSLFIAMADAAAMQGANNVRCYWLIRPGEQLWRPHAHSPYSQVDGGRQRLIAKEKPNAGICHLFMCRDFTALHLHSKLFNSLSRWKRACMRHLCRCAPGMARSPGALDINAVRWHIGLVLMGLNRAIKIIVHSMSRLSAGGGA